MKKTGAIAASTMILLVSALAAVGAQQGVAASHATTHTKRLVLHQTAIHPLSAYTYSGSDKAVSKRTGDVVGDDSYFGRFHKATARTVIQISFALKGGLLIGHFSFTGAGASFQGRITKGTGRYAGATGTISGRAPSTTKTVVNLRYHL